MTNWGIITVVLGLVGAFASVRAWDNYRELLAEHRAAGSNGVIIASLKGDLQRAGLRGLTSLVTVCAAWMPNMLWAVICVLQVLLIAMTVSDWFWDKEAAKNARARWKKFN